MVNVIDLYYSLIIRVHTYIMQDTITMERPLHEIVKSGIDIILNYS